MNEVSAILTKLPDSQSIENAEIVLTDGLAIELKNEQLLKHLLRLVEQAVSDYLVGER